MSENAGANILDFCKSSPDFGMDRNKCWDDELPSLTETVKREVGAPAMKSKLLLKELNPSQIS